MKDRKYITEEEFKLLINGRVKTKRESKKRFLRYHAILSLLYYHGLRRLELCELKWANINLSMKSPNIFVNRAKNGKSGTHPLVRGEYPLLCDLKDLSVGGKYVIENPLGGKIASGTIDKFFRTINKNKILPMHIHPHMLRHGCGHYMAEKGIDTRRIQDYLGHSSIASTVLYTTLSGKKFVGLWS